MSDHANEMSRPLNRRDFLKSSAGMAGALSGAALAGCSEMRGMGAGFGPEPVARPMDVVRIAYVGVGGMGTGHVGNLLKIEGAEIRVVCDIREKAVANAQQLCVEAGKPKPEGVCAGPRGYLKICDREDIDLVYTATPWEFHTPVCVAAMKAGKHAATEVPAAITTEECWELVETSEKTGKYCMMMENCCYGRTELMVLNMVRKGLFGELLHGECGYLHDLRGSKFNGHGGALWRTAYSIKRNANLYPTHGLGPVAQYMNINRGDRFDYLVSMSGPSRGLNEYCAKRFGPDSPQARQKYALGDVNVTLIKTYNGLTIYLVHDCNLPRPYSRINTIQGIKGIFEDYPPRIHIEGRTEGHEWETLEKYQEEFDHPLYKKMADKSKGAGHGGMDFIEDYRLIECLRTGQPTDQDVYDAASWSVVTALTETSVANRSRSVDFPDFTRGRWKTRPPLGIIEG
ncbi:MAG TPA: Gfo/Idh/MocA family oxidoreductase [Phycisphaerae bacterium]|nr:Gfo/Idh/MocA family oxidoreductase [Phycisphaerae bacterium]